MKGLRKALIITFGFRALRTQHVTAHTMIYPLLHQDVNICTIPEKSKHTPKEKSMNQDSAKKVMEKPKPKDFGCYGGFNDWPDKESKQRYQAAMAEYQGYLYSQMTAEEKENKNA